MMMQCWQYNDKMRPTFVDILHLLESTGMLYPTFAKVSFYHGEERHPPDKHEILIPTELEKVHIFNEEEGEEEEDEDRSSSGAGSSSGASRCTTPRKDDQHTTPHGNLNGYVTKMPPSNGNAGTGMVANGPKLGIGNGPPTLPVCKVTEC